ncbi:MAG: translational GTPase TypA [Pseudomonadota bacterium]|nr:translational GTPase TypA [Pseudomonadota bacterium]MEC9286575.1 translational GTPase TypA [Pseudomonadota bacterium]
MNVRNVAIIAHVDHGKTTLVDRLLQQTVIPERVELMERALDSNELERERGITILAKTTAVEHQGCRINIVDTPGHADFGGEVERILSMVDSVLLLVDAVEGPMPQTRFVTAKAFAAGLNPILVVNKIDRDGAAPDRVVDGVFDLFDRLGATERKLDFPVIFTSATEGIAGREYDNLSTDMTPLLDMLVEHVPPPSVNAGPFQMQVSTLDYSSYVGVIGIGRVRRGSATPGTRVAVIDSNGGQRSAKILSIQANRGLERIDLLSADAGDIVCITGIDNVGVSDTLCDPAAVEAMPALVVDEPTLTMTFRVNNSPFAGQEGTFLTSRQIRERLYREASHNVALRVTDTKDPDQFRVSGRGELHLSVLIETMRREGYELAVSRPTVITRRQAGVTLEPWEAVSIDVDDVHQGAVMESLGDRKGELLDVVNDGGGRVRLSYRVATRALMGFRSEFAPMTSGSGVMTCAAAGYDAEVDGLTTGRSNGVLVSNAEGRSVGYALFNLQNRGRLLIGAGIRVYEGMVVGIHSRSGDLTVNPMKEKKLTNIRAAGTDENILLTTPIAHSLEQALEFINDDELVEITPAAIRIRKKYLTAADRRRPGSNRDRS